MSRCYKSSYFLSVLLGITLFLTACDDLSAINEGVDESFLTDAAPAGKVTPVVPTISERHIEDLGEKIFQDKNLSLHKNQACASCHDPAWGFTGPNPEFGSAQGSVFEGSTVGKFGNRRPPTAAYATPSPVFGFDPDEGLFLGGNFLDGRATGQRLGSPAAEQSQKPFVNPVEQALPDVACVVYRVSRSSYITRYTRIWGDDILSIHFPSDMDRQCQQEEGLIPLGAGDRAMVDTEYDKIAVSIATFEASRKVNAFSSKFDAYRAGRTRLSERERLGLVLFEGKAQCNLCHPSEGTKALFTDYSYDNIGVPANPAHPDPGFVDLGLGAFLESTGEPASVYEGERGKIKVPTLRNLDKRPYPGAVKTYMHNGTFKSIKQVVHFYNTRDVLPTCEEIAHPVMGENCWPAPEVLENVNRDELGNLGLTDAEEDLVVAFLKTLTDGWPENY